MAVFAYLFFLYSCYMAPLIQYIKQSVNELHKVSFPSRKEATHVAIVSLVFTASLACLVALIDAGFDASVLGVSNYLEEKGYRAASTPAAPYIDPKDIQVQGTTTDGKSLSPDSVTITPEKK